MRSRCFAGEKQTSDERKEGDGGSMKNDERLDEDTAEKKRKYTNYVLRHWLLSPCLLPCLLLAVAVGLQEKRQYGTDSTVPCDDLTIGS